MSIDPYPFFADTLRYLYIDFNSYFASVEQQLRPELRGKPVAVVPVETDATCAIAASYEAKAFGIKTGTPIWEAKRICPELICVYADHSHYVEFHERIMKEIDRHIPVEAVCSIDEAACRLMKNEATPEAATKLAHSIKRGLAQHIGEYVKCSIGIAPNRYLAKVATDLKKPDGLTVLHVHDLPHRLYSLKLRDLPGIGANMELRLHRAGIFDMPSLMALNPERMRRIWGSLWGEKMWYLLRGADLPEQETTRSTIGHSHVMAPELRHPERAIHVARRLTMKAASRLRRLDYYASGFSFSARIESGLRYEMEAKCYRAQDNHTFLHLLDLIWTHMLGEIRGQHLKKVSVTLHRLMPASEIESELFDQLPGFDARKRGRAEDLSHAMDKLNKRYGRDSVSLGMLPSQGRSFSGTKVAFTRIPDMEEFLE